MDLDDMLDFEEQVEEEPEPEPEPEPVREEPRRPVPAFYEEEDDDEPALISGQTESSASGSMTELAQAVARKRAIGLGINAGHATLEDLVRDMLRPILKEWLDENLPYMIERLVKKEIERIVSRAEDL
jgi:cell pole-organizing protein PopZ